MSAGFRDGGVFVRTPRTLRTMRERLHGGRWTAARVYLLPAAILLAVFLPGLNAGFWRVDNPLYAAVAKHAWESGSLWTLHAGEQHYFNKPPLAFWAHGLPLHLFGAELWAARLPSFLVALATLMLSIDALRRLAGPRAALASGIVLALTLEFFRAMHAISLDLWLAMTIAGAVWCITRGLVSGRALRWSAAAGVCIGIGLMVKPMIALAALPLLAAWLAIIRQNRSLIGLVIAGAVAIIVALPWHLSMILTHGDAFTAQYFGSQIVDRVTTDAHGSEPWWKYLKWIGETYWPWLITLILGAALVNNQTVDRRARHAILLGVLFPVLWIAMLSVSSDKAGRYMIPVYPLASWVSGIWLARAFASKPDTRADHALSWAVAAAPALGLLLALFGPAPHQPIPPHWRELREFVAANADDRYCVPPSSKSLGAQLYLMNGHWPDAAPASADTAPQPAAGALLVTRNSGRHQPPPADTTVFENGAFTVTRLTSDWDGRYLIRQDAAPDNDGE